MPHIPSVLGTCLSLMLVSACADGNRPETFMDPPYDFTAGTVFGIIRTDDPSSFVCLHFRGRATRQMWDKRVSREFNHKVYLYDAYFMDGTRFEVHVNPEFESQEVAATETFRYMRGFDNCQQCYVKAFVALEYIAATRRRRPDQAKYSSIRTMPSSASPAINSRKPCSMNRFMPRLTMNI